MIVKSIITKITTLKCIYYTVISRPRLILKVSNVSNFYRLMPNNQQLKVFNLVIIWLNFVIFDPNFVIFNQTL